MKPPFARMKPVSQVRDAAHGGSVFIEGHAKKATMFSKPKGKLNYTFTDKAGKVTRKDTVGKSWKKPSPKYQKKVMDQVSAVRDYNELAASPEMEGLGFKLKPHKHGTGDTTPPLPGLEGVATKGRARVSAGKLKRASPYLAGGGAAATVQHQRHDKKIKKGMDVNPFGVQSHDVSKAAPLPGADKAYRTAQAAQKLSGSFARRASEPGQKLVARSNTVRLKAITRSNNLARGVKVSKAFSQKTKNNAKDGLAGGVGAIGGGAIGQEAGQHLGAKRAIKTFKGADTLKLTQSALRGGRLGSTAGAVAGAAAGGAGGLLTAQKARQRKLQKMG